MVIRAGAGPNWGVIADSKVTVALSLALVRPLTTSARSRRLGVMRRFMPWILAASGSLTKKFMTSATTSLCAVLAEANQ